MRHVREYFVEICWLILLVIVLSLAPSRSSATELLQLRMLSAFDWGDTFSGCSSESGWCL